MNSPLTIRKLLVKKSNIHGRGVYADQVIETGDTIEECCFLSLHETTSELSDYVFIGYEKSEYIMPLGFGCIYNHSEDPNAECIIDYDKSIFVYRAKRKINPGEEIFVFYSKNYFRLRGAKAKEPSLRYKLRKLKPFVMLLLRFTIVASLLIGFIKWIHA